MTGKIKILLFLTALIFIVFILVFFSYKRGTSVSLDKKGQDKIFIVNKGESVKDIGENLQNSGIIKSKKYFEIYIWRGKKEKDLKAGEYVLSPRMNIKEIAEILAGGKIINKEVEIKIIEGWRASEIEKYLQERGLVKDNKFQKIVFNVASDKGNNKYSNLFSSYKFLTDLPDKNLEGFLFPDTYRIFKDSSAEDIIIKMLLNFDKKLDKKMRADIVKQNKSIYEIIIMASLVEKEAKKPEEMKIVAGVFWNRIKAGQALQSDATLSYFLNDKVAAHTLEDLKIDTPFNTYKYKGLPPAPISNPGLNAINAAIYPIETEYNFFLTNPDTGEAVFSKTYAEHLKNKNKYLK